jgi:hypothetical protein
MNQGIITDVEIFLFVLIKVRSRSYKPCYPGKNFLKDFRKFTRFIAGMPPGAYKEKLKLITITSSAHRSFFNPHSFMSFFISLVFPVCSSTKYKPGGPGISNLKLCGPCNNLPA